MAMASQFPFGLFLSAPDIGGYTWRKVIMILVATVITYKLPLGCICACFNIREYAINRRDVYARAVSYTGYSSAILGEIIACAPRAR